jgi:hypothetical protein
LLQLQGFLFTKNIPQEYSGRVLLYKASLVQFTSKETLL